MQLHLPRARSHAVRRRIPAHHLSGREAEMFKQLSEYQPLGRMGTPEEVAALALYLCSDEASFITGQAYPIDGGVLAF
jgi:2-keto-3-deoxy-L-fuconate dehydrogenase